MSETPLDQQDRRMPEPSLIEWLRDQQRVFDQGGASKDRRPELAATLLERVIRQRDEATLEVCQLKKNCQCCRDVLSAARETILSAGGIEDRISPENDLRAEITTLRAQLEEARADRDAYKRDAAMALEQLGKGLDDQIDAVRAAAIEESAQVVHAFVAAALRHRDIITATDFADVEKTIRALIAGSTK